MLKAPVRIACCAVLLCGVAVTATGCAEMMVNSPYFKGNDINLLDIDYAAADMLAHQAKGMMRPGTPIRVGILANAYQPTATVAMPTPPPAAPAPGAPVPVTPVEPPGDAIAVPTPEPVVAVQSLPPAPFGKVVTEQIGGRLVELGFNIIGGSGRAKPGELILGGQYVRTNGRVLINLRLRDAGTGHILAVYDYSIPVSAEVNDLLGDDSRNRDWLHF